MIEHVVFDLDGTLIDNEAGILEAWQKTYAELTGREEEASFFRFALGIAAEDAFHQLGIRDSDAANQLWLSHYEPLKADVKPFDGVYELLSTLSQSYQLGIVSSKSRAEYEDEIPERLTSFMSSIILVEDSIRHKPHGDPLVAYMKKNNITADQMMYIGDTAYDEMCAADAGVSSIRVDWYGHGNGIGTKQELLDEIQRRCDASK